MVDLHGKYYDGHYSHARMIQSCYHLNCEIIWRLRRTNRELSVARLNSSEAELLLVRLSYLIRLGS